MNKLYYSKYFFSKYVKGSIYKITSFLSLMLWTEMPEEIPALSFNSWYKKRRPKKKSGGKSNNAKTNDPMTVWLHFAPYQPAKKKGSKAKNLRKMYRVRTPLPRNPGRCLNFGKRPFLYVKLVDLAPPTLDDDDKGQRKKQLSTGSRLHCLSFWKH